ncbi:NETR-like protein [Mya arenaria]|uniref:NETR-like protein n=1 Tax=Mya arenaria TaxID=6604 RepID=A0ABY7GDM6_MYAAR|nr:NETR-like protein [Mya arenaria]
MVSGAQFVTTTSRIEMQMLSVQCWAMEKRANLIPTHPFRNGGVALGSAYFGSGSSSSPIILDDLGCGGSEHSIFDCNHREFGTHNCGHGEDAGVICTLNGKIRLSGNSSASYYKGRVEIFLNNRWGTVCDDSFDNEDAMVVCHMLGFKRSGAVAKSSAYFGEGSSSLPIQLDDVSCSGTEQSIVDCTHSAIGTHNCGHGEDASVICQLY